MGLTIVGLVLNVAFAISSYFSNEKIKKLILKEKDMIRNRIVEIARTHQADIEKVKNDRKTFNDPKLNEAKIRIEDLEADVANRQYAKVS